MYHIGILGKPCRARYNVIRQLESVGYFRIYTFSQVDEILLALKRKQLSGVVVMLKSFQNYHVQSLCELSNRLSSIPLLFVAPNIANSYRREIVNLNLFNAGVIDYGHELKDLNFVLKAVLSGKKMPMRSSKRFPVVRSALLGRSDGSELDILLQNISGGGIQAKLANGYLPKGESVTVTIPYEDGMHHHMVSGKVAWCSRVSSLVGIQFDQENTIEKSRSKPLVA